MAEPKTNTRAPQAKPGTRQRLQKEPEPDLEMLVNELELRTDRLRASYDQYFMGIEKLPPHVQLKDVERRMHDLRKVQIRNTALRFKFQTILQRYNTYQSYWQRVARQIEEGTYKRDIRRANERFGAKRAPASELEIEVEFDDLVSEREEVEALMAESPPAGDADDDTLPPTSAPDIPEAPPTRPGDTLALLDLEPPDVGFPFVPPPPVMEGDPTRRHQVLTSEAPVAPHAATSPEPRARFVASRAPTRPVPAPMPAAPTVRAPVPAPILPIAPLDSAPEFDAPTRPAPIPALAIPRPAAANRPAAPPHAPATHGAKPPAPRPGDPDLTGDRMRQLYNQYIEAKRARQESTAGLTYDSLAKSLLDSAARLREKHAGKRVDFEVTIKAGKAILHPIVKDRI